MEKGAELSVPQGKFTITYRPTWSFPSEIEVKEKELDDLKDDAKKTGAATHTDKVGVRFTESIT